MFPVTINLLTDPVETYVLPLYFGGTVLNDDGFTVKSAPSVQLGYFIAVDTPRHDAMWVYSYRLFTSLSFILYEFAELGRGKTGQLSHLYKRDNDLERVP